MNKWDARATALLLWCVGIPLLITFEQYALGAAALGISSLATWRSQDAVFQRRFGVLIGCVALLGLAPISPSTQTVPALTLGVFFVAVLVLPSLVLAKDKGVIGFSWLPKEWSWLETFYVLAWGGFQVYFALSPHVPFHWALPPVPDDLELLKLFLGINAVGIWDELFFINLGFAVLRSVYPFWVANFAQAVLYVCVLVDMAFTGWGVVFIAFLALTQGIMFERSKVLLYVLVVHLIVDYFLFQAIVKTYYPGFKAWWHP
jgi:membrane protease YdiL (CAAX protease family)